MAMSIGLLSGDEDIVAHKNLPFHAAETSKVYELDLNPKSWKPNKGLVLPEKSNTHYLLPISQIEYGHYFLFLTSESSSNKSISPRNVEFPRKGSISDDDFMFSSGFSKVNLQKCHKSGLRIECRSARTRLRLRWEQSSSIPNHQFPSNTI